MTACQIGCGCGKHRRNVFQQVRPIGSSRRRQQQIDAAQLSDEELTPQKLFERQRARRYRKHHHESSVNGGGNHMATPSESFDWGRAIAGLRRILDDVYRTSDDDSSERYDDE